MTNNASKKKDIYLFLVDMPVGLASITISILSANFAKIFVKKIVCHSFYILLVLL